MIEWFKNLSDTEKIAIVVPVGLAAVGGSFTLLKWLFRKKSDPSIPQTKIQQNGAGHTAIVADGNKGNVAGRDIIIQKPAESIRQDIRPTESTKQVTLVIENLESEQFDTSYQRLFCFGIAGFLGIDPSDVKIVNVEKGSIKVTVEIPEKLVGVINKAVQEHSPEFEDAMKPLLVVRVETEVDKVLEKPVVERSLPAEALVKVNVRQLWGTGGFVVFAFVVLILAITCASRFGGGFLSFMAVVVACFIVLTVLAIVGRFMGVFSEGMVAKFLDIALKALRLGISKEKEAEVVTGRDIHTGIDSDAALNTLVKTSKELGRTEEENIRLKGTIKHLEEQLAQSQALTGPGEQQVPQPTQQAKDLAAQIEDDTGPYAQALKAIAQGNAEKADELLDETQQFLDHVRQKTDEAQAKIYMARMQNASYAGRPQDALKYCDRLTNLAGNDTLILNNIAAVYYANAEYKEAGPLMKRALKIDEASLGSEHPKVAIHLNNLAQLYQATNRLKEAEPLMQRALNIDETFFGKDHPKVATGLNNLARLYQATNRLRKAEPLYKRALNIDEAFFGKDHPKVAIRLNNLSALYQDTNRLKEAEPLYKRVVTIFEKSLGPDHTNVAVALNNLAALYQATNRLKEAESLMERALNIDEASLGSEHPTVAIRLNNLAQLYQATNRLKEAEPLMERALNIDEASLGSEHPTVAIRLNNLAQLYQDTNRLKEAEPLMKRALKIDEASLGKDHPYVARDLNNLAELLRETGRFEEAEPMYKRALEIWEKSLGKDHPQVATALNNLARLYQATNRLKETEPLMKRALKIDEASLGSEHPTVATSLNNLAALYQDTNRLKEAESLYKRVLNIDEASSGKDHPDVAIDLNNLAQLYKATNRLKEAGPLMKRVVEILLQFTRRTGHRHPHLEAAINNYGDLLMQMGCSKDEVVARLKRLAPEMLK